MKEPLAIVGMACRLPGADGLDAFWKLVARGDVAWGKLPESRFSRDLYFEPGTKGKVGKSYSELGAVVSDRPVDGRSCPLTPEMLDRYDVAHHIFLEVASQACRDAGMDPFAMPTERRTGVYVGHTGGSTRIGDYVYSTRIEEAMRVLGEVEAAESLLGTDVHAVAQEVTASIRGRHPGRRPDQQLDLGALGAAKIVQEALKLDGPYLVVDAACASSLQAMAIAARALLQGGIDQAIVGGASYCKSDSLVLFSAAQSVSNTGSCPFGKNADGLITAEGYVALVIKTLSRAVADGDRIRAVIRGIGVASDGKGKSLWAPRQEGQKLAVERAYPNRGDLSRLDYIEAHATSTQVGDATELGALSALLAPHMASGQQIPIGSVKANVGHTLETAGLASLVKVLLAMEHETIPPGSTAQELNDEFDWQRGPFHVPRQSIAWPRKVDGSPRLAAVNAFGIGGLNVHIALADHLPTPAAISPRVSRPDDDLDADAIAIVGVGAVLPGSLSVEALHERLDRGESALSQVPPDRWDVSRVLDPSGPRPWYTIAGLGGFVQGFAYDWRRHKVPPKQIAAANPLQFMLLEAADAAIADAGGSSAGLDRTRTGVVVGTMFGGEFANDLQIGLRLPETAVHLRAALRRRRLAEHDIDSLIAAYEKKVLERLPALIDETGSFTSSTLASRLTKSFDLMGGALALDAGDCSSISAISAAVDMLREGQCDAVLCAAGQRAMDLVAFEGMSLDGVLARKPGSALDADTCGRVPAEGAAVLLLKRLVDARAAGNTVHGVIRGVALRSAESVARALPEAVQNASEASHLQPGAVKAIEVIAAGTPQLDDAQLTVLANQYSAEPVAGALEPLVGHLGAAAGAVAVVKLMRSLNRGEMPGTRGLSRTTIRSEGVCASSQAQAIPAVDTSGYRAGAVTAIHGSLVGHVVIDNGKPVPVTVHAESAARQPLPTQASAPVSPAGRPLVAALFPGQGSQYTDMFRGLVEESSVARQCLASLDVMARGLGMETLAEIAWRPVNGLGTKVWDTQWGMYLADMLAWKTLRAEGFAPDFVASHSFGEFPSLAAVEAWSFEDGARATRARADSVEQLGPHAGAMLSVIADRATVTAAISGFSDKVWVCAENAPEQAVIGGTVRAVDAVELLLEGQRVRSKRLAVPSPFHTPLLAAAAARLGAAIEPLPIVTPRIPTFSSTTAEPLADAVSIRQSLIRQMTETVRWVSVVERLYQAGVRVFVEVGPSGVLTGLVRRILDGRDITVLQCDQRGRSPGEHLAKVVEQLSAVGAIQPSAVTPPNRRQVSPVHGFGRILSFDATERRRARNRAGGERPQPLSPRGANGHDSHGSNGNGHRVGQSVIPAAVTASPKPTNRVAGYDPPSHRGPVALPTTPTHQPRASESGGAAASASPVRTGGASVDLQNFLIDFVVEQTGYPPEIVEVDADLEADLGIDSIRKAQLFGEIGQKYGLTADDSVSLDDFRTLRHLLEYMLPRVGGSIATGATISASHASSSNGKATGGHVADRHETTASVAAVADAAVAEPGVEGDDLRTFLIDFVVEQTGYPRDIVELDADLEADLGIDSIRKAQLFGEIGQKYGLTADDSVSLDDFRTLRHLLEYMLPRVGGDCESDAATNFSVPTASTPTPRGDAYRRGVEVGRLHREAIRLWARQVSAADRGLRPAVIDPQLLESMEGVADGAAIDRDVLLAAFAAPATALGGSDLIAVSCQRPGVGVRGMVVGFGRVADPWVERFTEGSRSGVLIGVKGLPGGVAGWNDSGLMVSLGRGDRSAAADNRGGYPAALLIGRLVRECGTIEDAERLARTCGPIDQSIIVLHVTDGGVGRLDTNGRLMVLGEVARECDPRAALARILLADGTISEPEAVASLLRGQSNHSRRAALSAAGTWLAVGVVDGEPHMQGGSALGGGWLSPHEGASLPRTRSPRRVETSSITRRYGLVTRALAQPLPVRDLNHARVAIIGGGVVAARLAASLEPLGARPVLLPDGNHRQLCEALDREEAAGPIRHLVVATPWSDASGSWVQRRNETIVGPYFACQRWVTTRSKSGDLASSTMTAVTNLGGDFGLSGAVGGIESGALSGLFKGVAREFPDLQVRVADFSPSAAVHEIASAVVGVIRDDAGPIEIGHKGGQRCMIVPCETGGQADPTASRAALTRGSVWLVTGGARGVTAACARELGSRYGLTLAVVGSTQPTHVEPTWLALDEAGLKDLRSGVMVAAKARGDDPRHAWKVVEKSIEIAKSMAAFQAVGVSARYYACDLADATAVRALVGRVVADLGPVRGLVHGAGFEAACRFEKKTLEGLEATLGPKCIGFTNLLEAVDKAVLERVVAFGSTSGRMGGHGQADYSLANDMLAKMASDAKAASSLLRATVFHWHAWDEVGMASRPESRFVLEQFGLKFMPLVEGVRRFMDEIEAGQPDVEVLVTEPVLVSDTDLRESPPTVECREHASVAHGLDTARAMWGSLVADVKQAGDKKSVTFHLDPTADRFLLEHLQYGRPLLPGVMGLELLAQAGIAAQSLADVREIREFSIERPIGFADDTARDVRVDVAVESGLIEARAFTRHDHVGIQPAGNDVLHLRGLLVPGTPEPISEQCSEPPLPYYPTNYRDDSPLRHGPALRTLNGLFLDRSGGWARLTAPDENIAAQPRGAAGWTVPIALLDGCIMACGVYSFVMCGQRVEIPRMVARIRFLSKAAVGEKCTARLFFRSQDAKTTVYDVLLFGADGRGLLAVDGLSLVGMKPERIKSA